MRSAPACVVFLLVVFLRIGSAADAHVRLIRQIVRPELVVPSVVDAVTAAIGTPSSCVPGGAVVLSVTNKHHQRLRPVQFSLICNQTCFMQRVVSVCFNNVSDAFGTCVRSTFVVPPSDFRRSNYANLIWAKWKIISDALQVATVAMWLDADVLIMRNPWAELQMLGSTSLSQQQYAIRYQSEPPPTATQAEACTVPIPVCEDCASFNGGQLLVRSASVARAMYRSRPRNLSNTERLDQDWADAIINNNSRFAHLVSGRRHHLSRVTSCVLPDSFAAQCWQQSSFVRSESGRQSEWSKRSLCTRVTHHFNCVPSRKDKGEAMKVLARQWVEKCATTT
jgi:hypothetical protein